MRYCRLPPTVSVSRRHPPTLHELLKRRMFGEQAHDDRIELHDADHAAGGRRRHASLSINQKCWGVLILPKRRLM